MCTFNKIINANKLIVQFHVNNLKVSHQSKQLLRNFVNVLQEEFGKEDKLTENEGLAHD